MLCRDLEGGGEEFPRETGLILRCAGKVGTPCRQSRGIDPPVSIRRGEGVTEADDTKKRWQEYTEELYKKDLHDQDNHDGVITHLEPDILDVKSSGP